MSDQHFEPYLQLAEVTHDRALISWGGFWFRTSPGEEGLLLVDEDDLAEVGQGRSDTIGARSTSYGDAVVEVLDGNGRGVAKSETDDNFAWVEGLEPDTPYEYRVAVDGVAWAEDARVDWVHEGGRSSGLRPVGRTYRRRFRTHPALDSPTPITFAVLGDFGYGIRGDALASVRQREVARSLDLAADRYDVRLVLTVGDNVYLTDELQGGEEGDTGDEDDDWFFTFFQPYRYLLDRLPWYPVVGNHDAGDTEKSDDRDQLADNFFIEERFRPDLEIGRTSLDPGLFYSLNVGRWVDLVAIDTTEASDEPVDRYFEDDAHLDFLEDEFPDRGGRPGDEDRWHIPFSHHPAYCAGPKHYNDQEMIERLVPLWRRAGVRLALAGHEHNFQWAEIDGIHHVVAGGGSKRREGTPDGFAEAGTRAWSQEAHCLIVELREDRVVLTPLAGIDEGEDLRAVSLRGPDGEAVPTPIEIDLY